MELRIAICKLGVEHCSIKGVRDTHVQDEVDLMKAMFTLYRKVKRSVAKPDPVQWESSIPSQE